jgi:hypothetical protein
MTSYNFTPVEVPSGTFIGWGPNPGQSVTRHVVSYAPSGGTDFNQNPCPQIVGVLTADCATYKDKGATKERVTAGTMVTINAGQANLRRNVLAADPQPGDVVLFDWTGDRVADHVGLFDAWIDRDAGRFRTVEGNTSSSSDSDGGAVEVRERSTSQVRCFMRMSI